MEGWLYFADLNTYKVHPLCSKLGCNHEKEEFSYKCDAFVGTDPRSIGSFLELRGNKLYVSCMNAEMNHCQLVEMKEDGSARKVLIEDISNIDINSMMFHRGYFYYTTNEQKENGKFVQQIRRTPIKKIGESSEVLVEVDRSEKEFFSVLPFLPLNDSLFFTEQAPGEDTGADLFQYDFIKKEKKVLAESEAVNIYGAVDGHLILLGKEGKHIEYSPETGEFEEVVWLNKLHEEHLDWKCQAGCINEDFALMFIVTNTDGKLSLNPDLVVVNREGNALCELVSSAHAWTSPQVLSIRGEKYLVIYGPNFGSNNTLDLYKVRDLMQGKAEPERIQSN